MRPSLVIMAAGLAARYGGGKQVAGVGPRNEILMEYAVYDAIRAGFHKIVFIIKPEMRDMVEALCGNYLREKTALDGTPVEVSYAFQDFSSLPAFYAPPVGRTKPFGTVHALLCAEKVVREPFCVLNADDYYGPGAYRTMYGALGALPAEGRALMVGYLLKNTASLYGTVSRGICSVGEEGALRSVQETKSIRLFEDGTLRDMATDSSLDPEAVVSMNFWGFAPSIFPLLRRYFEGFLRSEAGEEPNSECLLPIMVDSLLRRGELEVSVLRSPDRWFGMTYREDRETVARELRRLHEEGVYPESLRH